VIFGGAKFHVPDSDTLTRLYGGVPIFDAPDGSAGPIPGVPVDGTLLREENGTIWVITHGQKSAIPDMATLQRRFAGVPTFQVWNHALDSIPNLVMQTPALNQSPAFPH
jgi:hypothetical protein